MGVILLSLFFRRSLSIFMVFVLVFVSSYLAYDYTVKAFDLVFTPSYLLLALLASMLVCAGVMYYDDWQGAYSALLILLDKLSDSTRLALESIIQAGKSLTQVSKSIWDEVISLFTTSVPTYFGRNSYVPSSASVVSPALIFRDIRSDYDYYFFEPKEDTVFPRDYGYYIKGLPAGDVFTMDGTYVIRYRLLGEVRTVVVTRSGYSITFEVYDSSGSRVRSRYLNANTTVWLYMGVSEPYYTYAIEIDGWIAGDIQACAYGYTYIPDVYYDAVFTPVSVGVGVDVLTNPVSGYDEKQVVVPLPTSDWSAVQERFFEGLKGKTADTYGEWAGAGTGADLTGILGVLQGIWDFLRSILDSILGVLQGIWDFLRSILDSILGVLQGIWSALQSLVSGVSSISDALTTGLIGDLSIDYAPLMDLPITTKFPFSLPFDVYNAISGFTSEGDLPELNIGFYDPVNKKVIDNRIDLGSIDFIVDYAPYVRAVLLFCYVLGLVYATRRLLGGGV